MALITEILTNKLNKLDVIGLTKIVVNDKKTDIADLNREQLLEGQLSNDTPAPVYSPNTEKSGPRGIGNTYTLKENGTFHESIGVTTDASAIVFFSTDIVLEQVVEQAKALNKQIERETALGLNSENQFKLREILVINLRTKIRNVIS